MPQTAMESEQRQAAKARKQLAKVGRNQRASNDPDDVLEVDWHLATLRSVSFGALGVLHAVSLCIHVIGRTAAWAQDKNPKHAVEQIDRLLSK
jgi:hypothetical protein